MALTLPRLAVLAAVIAVVAFNPDALLALGILFVLIVPCEKLFPRHRQKLCRPGAATDIAYALLQPVLAFIGVVVAIVVGLVTLAWIPGLLIRPLVGLIPATIAPFVGIALFDIAVYWVHRWSHEVPFLWRFHAVHHSPARMDWVSGFRVHPIDGALVAPPFVFLLAAGFSAEFTGVLAVIQAVTGLFLHANVRWRWRPLHRIVITPEFHHWHHANEHDARNTNYSVFLPLWDLLFRTYYMPADRRPLVYGVSEPMPDGVLAQLHHPLRGIPGPRWTLRHPVLAASRTGHAARRGLTQLRRSTFRPPRVVAF